MRGFCWNNEHAFSIFVLLCYTIGSIMHAETAATSVFVSMVLRTDSLSTDPGRTCWSQGWSSRSSDHPSDCQSQSSSRTTCPLTEQMWFSVLRSSPQNTHWKTEENISLAIAPKTHLHNFILRLWSRLHTQYSLQWNSSEHRDTYWVTSLLFHLFSWWS